MTTAAERLVELSGLGSAAAAQHLLAIAASGATAAARLLSFSALETGTAAAHLGDSGSTEPAEPVETVRAVIGGGIKTRRRIVGISPFYAPAQPVEEDEALLLIGLI